jgi:hypothetical protein
MNALDIKIKEARDRSEEWIAFLATCNDKRLSKKLRINRTQQVHATEQENEKAYTYLRMMEEIIIQARIYKEENNIEDQLDELEENVKNIETYTSIQEDRRSTFIESAKKMRKIPIIENDEDQLSLFN